MIRPAEPLGTPSVADPTTIFDLITFVDLRDATYLPDPVPRSRLRNRILFVRTGHGTYAKLQIAGGDDLHIGQITAYTADGDVSRAEDRLTAHSSYLFDVDSASEVASGGDLWWHGVSPGVHCLEAVNGAQMHEVPGIEEVPYTTLRAGGYDAGPIPGSALREQMLFCRTGTGRLAALLVDADHHLTVRRLVVFDSRGIVRLDRANIVLPRTHTLEVDTGTVGSDGGDLWWQAEDATHCVLTPIGGARLCLPSFARFRRYLQLLDEPAVQTALVYRDGSGQRAYPGWSRAERLQLWEYLYLRETGRGLPLAGPPPLVADRYLRPRDARRVYLTHVAQSIWVDANTVVPWRLSDANAAQLALLLDMRSFLAYRDGYGHYFDPMGVVTAWNPAFAYEFLTGGDLLSAERSGTIANVLDWCRANLRHITSYASPFDGGPFASQADQYEYLYGYRGWPLVERMITPLPGREHITHGCWGTCGFLAAVLRTVNIPVLPGESNFAGDTHGRPEFPSIGRGLTHGDDPYEAWIRLGHHNVPIERILLDQAQLATLIDAPPPRPGMTQPETALHNQQASFAGLAVEYRTEHLLRLRCRDREAGATDPSPLVWTALHAYYSDEEIKAIVGTLDDAIDAITGGCSAIIP